MKIVWSLLIGLFSIHGLLAQITTSVPVSKTLDTVSETQLIEPLEKMVTADTTIVIKALDSTKLERLVRIKQSVLDSLLAPFYEVVYDTVKKDTVYKQKFRMYVDENTLDTSYVPLPKKENYIYYKRTYGFHPIVIKTPVSTTLEGPTKMAPAPVWWKRENKIGLAISQSSFANWNAGGENSIAGTMNFSFIRKFQKLYTLWNNEIFVNYGLNYNDENGLRKTDDKVQINSTFGYRKDTISNWYYSVRLNFNTQFTDGFKYPDTDNPISRFFAPAYLQFGAGSEYNLREEKLSVYLSPLTLKSTFVFDKRLSDDGAFGVDPGNRSRHEFGMLVQSAWEKKVFENIIMNNRLSLYTDYVNEFGNIDVDWIFSLNFVVNKWIKASLATQLIYDNDVKYKEDIDGDGNLETLGPRVQFKQVLNIGVAFNF